MNWDTKRKAQYFISFATFVIAIVVFFARDIIFPEPTCFDTKQNGYELGVDCGGTCSLRCTQEVKPLTVEWSKALPVAKGLYDFVGMVRNTNIDNASKELTYTFVAYGDEGQELSTLSGKAITPLDGTFPIIIQNISLDQKPRSVALTLLDGNHYKVIENPSSPTIRILERRYEPGVIPRVYVTIMNTKRLEITNLPVRVVLFDAYENAYAVGQTLVPVLPKEGVQELTITWNEPLPYAPSKIGVYPIFNPFEGVGY